MKDSNTGVMRYEKLKSLNRHEKDITRECLEKATNEAQQLSRRNSVEIILTETEDEVFKVVRKSKQLKTQPTFEEKLASINLDGEVNRSIIEDRSAGRIKTYNGSDIIKTNETYPIGQLTPVQQRALVDKIVANRINIKSLNDLDVIYYALKNGEIDPLKAEIWFSEIMHWLEKVTSWLGASAEVLGELDSSQKQSLCELLAKLCAYSQRICPPNNYPDR